MAIKQFTRTFEEYRSDLLTYIRDNYPDLESSFTDSDIGQILLELNAAVASNLSSQIDLNLSENQLEFAQLRRNLFELAKNVGLKLKGKSASVTVVDFTFDIPVEGDSFAESYLPVIKAGTQVIGNGQTFEVIEDIDFRQKVSNQGIPNLIYKPRFDANKNISRYEVTKREIVYNGKTKQFKKVINNNTDFYTIVLPDRDVLSIEQVIILSGIDNGDTLEVNEFFNDDNKWYEVDYLAQPQVFIPQGSPNDRGYYTGVWKDVSKKFIKEFTPNGYCKIIFGNGKNVTNDFKNILKDNKPYQNFLNGVLNNNSLGERVPTNSTIFIRYRVGGGTQSNVPANVINKFGFKDISINGSRQDLNNQIEQTGRVTNPIPALGGREELETEEIRNLIRYNNSAKYKAANLEDYILAVKTMPGKFGSPYKVTAIDEDNKIVIFIVGINNSNRLTNASLDPLKLNIKEYLQDYRILNDYVEVRDAKIINISLDISVLLEKEASQDTVNREINQVVRYYFDVSNIEINQNIYIGELYRVINDVSGVVNINDIKVYNEVDTTGNIYSPTPTSMGYVEEDVTINDKKYRKEVQLVDNILFTNLDEVVELRDPVKDIRITTKKLIF